MYLNDRLGRRDRARRKRGREGGKEGEKGGREGGYSKRTYLSPVMQTTVTDLTARSWRRGSSMFSRAKRFTRPEKTDCRPSLNGRVESTAS